MFDFRRISLRWYILILLIFPVFHLLAIAINAWMGGENAAWSKYLAGGLDTVAVPMTATLTPELRQQIHMQSGGGTYYYGFSVSQAPWVPFWTPLSTSSGAGMARLPMLAYSIQTVCLTG